MEINSLLNEGPASNPGMLNPGGASTYMTQPVRAADNSFSLNTSHKASASDSVVSQLLSQNSPHRNTTRLPRDPTIPSRNPYHAPSLLSSTAATSPLDASIPPLSVAIDRSAHSGMAHESRETIPGSGSSFPGRTLPPLTPIPSALAPCEGPLSPRSTGTSHYHYVGSETGYFSTSRGYYQDQQQQQQQCQQPFIPIMQQPRNHNNALMSFAEVAMETATAGGRRTLELEAAAEASRRESDGAFALENSIRRNSAATAIISRNQAKRVVSSRAGRDDGIITSNKPLFLDLDPSLRPSSADSAASTGRAIEEDNEAIPRALRLSAVTQNVDSDCGKTAPLFRPTPEPHSPPDNANSVDIAPSVTPGSGPLNIPSPSPQSFLNEPPKCSYCNVCTTGSPLRKVVSHIFGRNKLSTRQIPKNVWVYYCRKHYQRSRYRNPRGFARQQVLLVKRQCERLQLWGGVKDWVIKVRRREELRITREGGENGDEADEGEDDIEEGMIGDEEPEPDDGGPTSGESSRRNSIVAPRRRSSAGGGSNWIMKHTGMGKSIGDIYNLLEKIEIEVQENGGKFPDVELLPNVDLTMAVPLCGTNSGGDVGGNGNADDDGNQDDADDGVSGRSAAKKRRRSDGGSGSSGGDDAARGSKKARSPPTKKGDRKGKGKGSSHAEFTPDDVPKDTSNDQGNNQFRAYEINLSRGHLVSSVDHRHGLNGFTNGGSHAEYREAVHPEQTATPPPSTSSTGRSTPEFEEIQRTHQTKYLGLKGHAAQEFYKEAGVVLYDLSPRRSARTIHATVSTPKQPEYGHGDSTIGTSSSPASSLTPRQLAAIAGEPLHRFDLRRQDSLVLGELLTDSNTRKGPEKNKSHDPDGGTRRARTGRGGSEVFEFIRVATSV